MPSLGPGSNPRGVSLELGLRHGDARIRVLCSYSPVLGGGEQGTEEWAAPMLEEVTDEAGAPMTLAYRLELGDVVVIRERLESRPLQLDNYVDPLWRMGPTTLSAFENRAYSPSDAWRLKMDMQGQSAKQPVPLLSDTDTTSHVAPELFSLLDLLLSGTQGTEDSLDLTQPNDLSRDQDRDPTFNRLFPGALLLSAPRCINAGESADIRVGWAPSAHLDESVGADSSSQSGLAGAQTAYVAGVSIVLTEPCVIDSSGIYVKPPQLTDYYVDVLAGGV
jgi:hypothetical protein